MLTSSVEVLWTARYDYQPAWKLERHKHVYFQIIYFLKGSGRFLLNDREQAISPGDLFLIRPHQYHGLTVSSVIKTLDIKFVVKDARLHKSLLGAATLFSAGDPNIPHLFERIRQEGERKAPLFRELCGTYLLQILILLLRQDCRQSERAENPAGVSEDDLTDGLSKRVVKYLHEHYTEEICLSRVARLLGVTDRRIRQKFQEHVGTPPLRYLLQYRVEKAKELISYSEYALKEIAERVGFKNIHHFTRVFSEIAGVSPGAWRQQYCEGIRKDVCIAPRFSNINRTIKDPPR